MNGINTESRTERISRMERYFDTLSHAVENDMKSIGYDTSLQSMLRALTAYFENGQWIEDYEADERGELPSYLKRGVLSQDLLYNLLCEIEQLNKED